MTPPPSPRAFPVTLLFDRNGAGSPNSIKRLSHLPDFPVDSGRAFGGLRDPGVVGYLDNDAQDNTPYHAFLWTDTAGVIDLGSLGDATSASFATDGSHSGAVVTGFSNAQSNTTDHAFKWTQAGGMVDLGTASGASGFSRAFGISDDGTAIVGESDFSSAPRHAFRWTQAGGFQDLGALQPPHGSIASGITADGTVVVGNSGFGSGGQHAFRWTQAGGMQDIGTLTGMSNATATGVSDNGNVIVGYAAPRPVSFQDAGGWDFDPSDSRAFRWSSSAGMQDLTQLFAASGINMTGITLVAVTGISTDGQIIVGVATTPTSGGQLVNFIAEVCDAGVGSCLLTSPFTNISSSGPMGGPFSPTSFQYQLAAAAGSLNFQITGIPSWLNANFTSGNLTTSPMTLTLSLINVGSLLAGAYPATISFTNTDSDLGDTTRDATLVIWGSLNASPASGTHPLNVTFTTTVTQGDPNTYTVSFGDGSANGALSIRPSGILCTVNPPCQAAIASTSHTYTSPGNYTASLINSAGASVATANITVSGPATPVSQSDKARVPLPVPRAPGVVTLAAPWAASNTPYKEGASRDLCEASIKSAARHASTANIKWFSGYATKISENGNRIVRQDFSAKNDFGLETTYTAICDISPDGHLDISISER